MLEKSYDTQMEMISQSAQETQVLAGQLAQHLTSQMAGRVVATVVALRGELGAGKTTFVQGLAKALGIKQLPKSPTFLLAKEYKIPGTEYALWHLDCYRLNGHQDLVTLDLHSLFADPRNIMLIEWPERIGDGLPRQHLEVHFVHKTGDKRGITITEK